MFCIAQALQITRGIKFVSLEGNPIGKVGIRFLMNAQNRNLEQEFTVNIKNAQGETNSAADNQIQLFDAERPEGPYQLDLTKIYDQFVLQHLLTISSELAKTSVELGTASFEQKQCFYQVKCDGKSKWDPPNIKTTTGIWDLGPEPKGKLEFSFTCEPLEYKKEVAKLAKEA